MKHRYEILDLTYQDNDSEQHLFPVVLSGEDDIVLVDCGYPNSLEMLEDQLRLHNVAPNALTKLVLTHQDDDHMGSAAEWKEKYPAIQIVTSPAEAPYISGDLKNLRLQQAEALQRQLPEDQKALGEQFCARFCRLRPVVPDLLVSSGDQFSWGGGCEIIASPGHTPGHISIRALDNAFMVTGDAAVIENGDLAIANPSYCLNPVAARRSLNQLLQYRCHQYICYHGGLLTL